MSIQHSWFKRAALLIPLLIGSADAWAFPEIPFCPLGGPTGWWNRMTDDDDHRYYRPPPYYPPPVAAPYRTPVYPYSYGPQQRQAYPPQIYW